MRKTLQVCRFPNGRSCRAGETVLRRSCIPLQRYFKMSKAGSFWKRKGEEFHSRPRQINVDEAAIAASPIIQAFEGFQLELDARYDKYERLVKLSRDVTIESKRAIFLLHRCSTTSGSAEEEVLTESDAKLAAVRLKIRDIAVELQGEDLNQYHRAISPGLQEYVEAVSFQHFLRTHKLIGLEEVNRHLEFSLKGSEPRQKPAAKLPLPLPDYILGVADLTGELMRVCIMSMGSGSADPDTPFRLCQFVRSIYDGFCILGNSGPHELSRKLPVLRQSLFKMEDACYALRVRGSEFPHNILASMVSLHERGNHDECDVA